MIKTSQAGRKRKAERRQWRKPKGINSGSDRAYLAFIASQPCVVTGERPVTVHHVRSFGSHRDDRRTIPLVARLHMRTHEQPGYPCIERGKQVFERHWGINIETEIRRLRALWDSLV